VVLEVPLGIEADSLLSGLIGGLLGAIIGAGVTLWAQASEHRHQGEIAARAVHAEMAANSAGVRLLLAGGSLQSFVMNAWELRAADVARILPADDFYKVALAYTLIPECRRMLDRAAGRSPVALKPAERETLEGMLPNLTRANDILRSAAWKKGNAPTLDGLAS
jgi:hypothetical protein